MALTERQKRVLRLIAANRSPNSLFAGGAVANRDGPRLSQDLDIEHASIDAVLQSFQSDEATLLAAGYAVRQSRRSRPHFGFIEAVVGDGGGDVLLDWTYDTAVRFFPAIQDTLFGWRLHVADVALNKLLALAGRRAVRDYYDVARLHEAGFYLGTLAWAAMGKDSGMSPDLVLDEASRNAIYPADAIELDIASEERIDPVDLKRRFLSAMAEARDQVAFMTANRPDTVGTLALSLDGELASLNEADVERRAVTFHEPTVGGAWPTIA